MASNYGQGSVSYDETDQLWVGRVELDPLPDGKRRRKVIKGKSKTAVLKKMREAQTARDRGEPSVNETTTVRAWLEHWSDEIVPTLDITEKTAADYRFQVRKHLIPRLGRVHLAKLNAEHVERQLMGSMREEGLSPRSIALARNVLGMALATAERRGKVRRNVVPMTKAPKKAPPRLDPLSTEDAQSVLKAAQGDRLEALAVIILFLGLRRGEALRLRWDDVDLDAKTLSVVKAKTQAGVRTIPMPDAVVKALRSHQRRQKIERMAADAWGDPGLVFASTVGTVIDGDNAYKWWQALCLKAGIGRRRFHATRHTAATLMLNNGVPLEVIRNVLGHASIAITADLYAKVEPETLRTAAKTMDQVLGGRR
jgi:integrase